MRLVQILLPLRDRDGRPFPRACYAALRCELTERHGGVTAYMRSPAIGLWEDGDGAIERDDVVLVEVVVEAFDRAWWREYAGELARRFGQDEVLVRAIAIEVP